MIEASDFGFRISVPAVPALLLHHLAETVEDAPSTLVPRRPQTEPADPAYRAWRASVQPLGDAYAAVTVPLPERAAGLHAIAKAAVLYADGRVWPGRDALVLRWVPVENLPALWEHLSTAEAARRTG